ncbi:hypothetical protein FQA39_LY03156 [Lamprigera yunnana]|nr:hypothetical protein FQA39_LY03156 [Lamprigera yunnana]
MDRKRRKHTTICLTRRRTFNVLNVIFTLCVLILAVQVANSNFTARINKISDDLHRRLGDALELDGPNFTDVFDNVTYNSVLKFNARGMGGLYNITNMFMNVIISKEVFPEGFVKVIDGHLELASFKEQWQTLLTHYAALIAVIIVLLIFGILMPLCGLCFCCCRCCGKCGARSKPFDKKGDLCRKICLATLLISVGTLMLFGVVCAFVSNQHMQDGTNELAPNLKIAVDDTDVFINATTHQVQTLFNTNYKEFEILLFSTLDECSAIVLEQLREYSNATALTEVVNIVNGLVDIKSSLTFMRTATKELQLKADDLNSGLNKVKYYLLNTLKDCESLPACNELYSEYISPLHLEVHYNNIHRSLLFVPTTEAPLPRKLPDISNEIEQLSSVLDSEIEKTVAEGLQAFENIQVEINNAISLQIPKVKKSVKKVGKEITTGSSSVIETLTKVKEVMHETTDAPLKDVDKYLKEYSPYRYYIGLAVSCILLLITLCITLGLICGICGKRPDAYSDDCCNKGAGSRFLMIGVGLMFLFAIILVAIMIIHFFIGVVSQRIVCDSFREHENNQIINLVDQVLNIKESVGLDVNISWILSSCNQNLSIYTVLHLESQFNLNEVMNYVDKFEINKILNELTGQINANTNVVILSQEAKEHLEQLILSGIADIKYDTFIDELSTNLTNVDLDILANKLDDLIAIVQDKLPNNPDLPKQLIKATRSLRRLQQDFIVPMTALAKDTIIRAQDLKQSLNFGKESFEVAINDLIDELEAAQLYLQVNGSATMIEIANDFGHGVEKQVRTYLNRVVNNTRDSVGLCGPLSSALNSTLIGTCDMILLPWNGFWFSLMWCLLLFIPTIIFSVKLATLYQKYEPYPGPLVEVEFLYDAYADRDNIPLNSNVHDKRSKKNKKKHKRYERGSYGPDAGNEHGIPREIPSGSHFQDARYADMAPKYNNNVYQHYSRY